MTFFRGPPELNPFLSFQPFLSAQPVLKRIILDTPRLLGETGARKREAATTDWVMRTAKQDHVAKLPSPRGVPSQRISGRT